MTNPHNQWIGRQVRIEDWETADVTDESPVTTVLQVVSIHGPSEALTEYDPIQMVSDVVDNAGLNMGATAVPPTSHRQD